MAEPDGVWSGDITYTHSDEGWLFPAVVTDLLGGPVAGSSLRQDRTGDTAVGALRMACFERHPSKQAELIFHSDAGCQYVRQYFRDLPTECDISGSMSRRGKSRDNA